MQSIREKLKKYNITPSKKLGQNFLLNDDVLDIIINSADLKSKDFVVEIGPGLGVLTDRLVKKVNKVLTVELDDKLFKILQKEFKNIKNLEILNKNILNIPNENLLSNENSYKVIANIPYSITSPILKKFTSQHPKPESMVLLIQKEVAERISANPGELSILGIAVQLYYKVEYISTVSKTDFYPVPKVDSAIVKLVKHNKYEDILEKYNILEKELMRIVKIGFSSKRKMLKNNLASGLHISTQEALGLLKKANLKEKIRAQELSIKDWINICLFLLDMI